MKVLLVEDSEEVRAITIEYLQELGHEVDAVEDAEQAVLRVQAVHFDAVMTDLSLPGMSGIQLTAELLRAHPALPVIVCSGHPADKVRQMLGEKLRSALVLSKPYDWQDLQDVLAAAAAQRHRPA
jgi:two-component system cell cycle sensor histidine kinase/response regulator CckA